MTDPSEIGQSGVERLRTQRFRFWRFVVGGLLVAVIVGVVTGLLGEGVEDGTFPVWALAALWAIALIAFGWFTVRYLRSVDEVDLHDNLWAVHWAFYFYIVSLPSWYLFHQVGAVGPPDQLVIFFATSAMAGFVYLARKLGFR